MASIFWPKTLAEACIHAYHPGLHSRMPEDIAMHFLWRWGTYPSDVWPIWEQVFVQGRDEEGRFAQDIFPLLQRALDEGQEDDRIFALFLAGAFATPEARKLLSSFLDSAYRKERWASAISLGRLKEERVFSLLQTYLLEGFTASELFANGDELQAVQEVCHLYRRMLKEHGSAALSQMKVNQDHWHLIERLESINYEWYLRQRAECALVLGAWGNSVAGPRLREALQAAWKMEQDWPEYEGPDESGPGIWHFFQDRIAFALGQLGVWDAFQSLHLPEDHLLVARIYLTLGALQINDGKIFYGENTFTLFCDSPAYLQDRASMEKQGIEVSPFVEPAKVKQLLAEHFGLSPTDQESYLMRFPKAWHERTWS